MKKKKSVKWIVNFCAKSFFKILLEVSQGDGQFANIVSQGMSSRKVEALCWQVAHKKATNTGVMMWKRMERFPHV